MVGIIEVEGIKQAVWGPTCIKHAGVVWLMTMAVPIIGGGSGREFSVDL